MGRMSYIHYLCEKQDENGLLEETGSEEMAKHFLDAHQNMRKNKDNPEFKVLNKIVDKSIEEYEKNPQKVKLEGKNATADMIKMIEDVRRPN
jgi:hypothetical protein